MINLWCPFRKGLQDVMCIFYLPSAVLHQLGTQALQNWFLMKCRVDLLTPPSWWGKIYPFVEVFFSPCLQSWEVLASLGDVKAVTRGTGQASELGHQEMMLQLWCYGQTHPSTCFYHAGPLLLMHKVLNLQTKEKHNLHTPVCFTIPLLSFPPWFN